MAMKMMMKSMAKMKVMKMKTMKKMKKAMKKSVVGKKASVFAGRKMRTTGGLKKENLMKNKRGKVVSKKASAAAKKRGGFFKILKWSNAVKAARKFLGLKGFVAVGGKSGKGKALLMKSKSIYGKK
jgi:hypothetical protein